MDAFKPQQKMSCQLSRAESNNHQSSIQVPFYLEMAGLQLGSSAVIRSLARQIYGLVNPYMVVIVRESPQNALNSSLGIGGICPDT